MSAPPRRTLILGAGASACYTGTYGAIPVTSQLLTRGLQLRDQGGCDAPNITQIVRLAERYYHKSLSCLDVEELLTFAQMSRDDEAVRQLLHLVCWTLTETLGRPPATPDHAELLDSLGEGDTVVTFNWDLLLDNILHSKGQLNYGSRRLCRHPESEACGEGTGPQLLKLHGSLNWLRCTEGGDCAVSYFVGQKVVCDWYARPEDFNCPTCAAATRPLMVPPVVDKQFDHQVLHDIWKEAAESIKHATELIIIGYSLPAADTRAACLLRQSAADATDLVRVHLFDKQACKLRTRYEDVLGRPVVPYCGGTREAATLLAGEQPFPAHCPDVNAG